MVRYTVIVTNEFEKERLKLEKRHQKRVLKILKKLETGVLGSPLKYELKGFYSVHFEHNHYRLVYYKEDSKLFIMALHVGKRKNTTYKKLKERVKRNLKKRYK